MPYEIRKEEDKFAVYRLPYPGETGEEEKVAESDTLKNAEMYVAFASRKEDEPKSKETMGEPDESPDMDEEDEK